MESGWPLAMLTVRWPLLELEEVMVTAPENNNGIQFNNNAAHDACVGNAKMARPVPHTRRC